MPKQVEYVYAVKGQRSDFVKLGRWTGTVKTLASRYKTVYGPGITMFVYQCVNSIVAEQTMFDARQKYHWSNELYETDVIPALLEHCSKTLQDHVQWDPALEKLCRLEKTRRAIEGFQNKIRGFLQNTVVRTGNKRHHVQRAVLYDTYVKMCHKLTDVPGKHKWFQEVKRQLGSEDFHTQKKVLWIGKLVPRRDVWITLEYRGLNK